MAELEKVIKDLEKLCKSTNTPFVCFDALQLLKEQQQQIWELQDQVEYLTDKQKKKFLVDSDGKITPLPVVVRCKDCKNNNQCSIQFKFANADNPGDWYCADGKRKLQKAVTGVKLNPDGTWTAITCDKDCRMCFDPMI